MSCIIPPCYYNSDLLKEIDDLIEEGNESYSELSMADKDRVTAKCIEILGDDAYSCLVEFNLDSTLATLKKFIKSRSKDDSHRLANVILKNAEEYFTEAMDQLFDERRTDNVFDFHIGLLKYQIPNTQLIKTI